MAALTSEEYMTEVDSDRQLERRRTCGYIPQFPSGPGLTFPRNRLLVSFASGLTAFAPSTW